MEHTPAIQKVILQVLLATPKLVRNAAIQYETAVKDVEEMFNTQVVSHLREVDASASTDAYVSVNSRFGEIADEIRILDGETTSLLTVIEEEYDNAHTSDGTLDIQRVSNALRDFDKEGQARLDSELPWMLGEDVLALIDDVRGGQIALDETTKQKVLTGLEDMYVSIVERVQLALQNGSISMYLLKTVDAIEILNKQEQA